MVVLEVVARVCLCALVALAAAGRAEAQGRDRRGAPPPGAPLDPAKKAEAEADERWLVDAWKANEERFRAAIAVRFPSGNLGTTGGQYTRVREESAAQLKALEAFEAELPALRERLAAIEARWGTADPNKLRDLLADAQGKKRNETTLPIWRSHDGLKDRLKKLPEARERACKIMVGEVDAYLGRNSWVRYAEAGATLELALAMHRTDALAARVAGWADEVARHKAANKEKIDAQPLPVHLKTWSGPGAPDDLGRSACELLAAPADFAATVWLYDHQGPWTFHRAWVRFPWGAQETVLGRVTQWGLFVEVALSDRDMQADGVAAIVPFRLKCAQHAEKATPWVDAHWEENPEQPRVYVRLAKLQGGAPSPTPSTTAPHVEPGPANETTPGTTEVAPGDASSAPSPVAAAASEGSGVGGLVCVLFVLAAGALGVVGLGAALFLRSRAGPAAPAPPTG